MEPFTQTVSDIIEITQAVLAHLRFPASGVMALNILARFSFGLQPSKMVSQQKRSTRVAQKHFIRLRRWHRGQKCEDLPQLHEFDIRLGGYRKEGKTLFGKPKVTVIKPPHDEQLIIESGLASLLELRSRFQQALEALAKESNQSKQVILLRRLDEISDIVGDYLQMDPGPSVSGPIDNWTFLDQKLSEVGISRESVLSGSLSGNVRLRHFIFTDVFPGFVVTGGRVFTIDSATRVHLHHSSALEIIGTDWTAKYYESNAASVGERLKAHIETLSSPQKNSKKDIRRLIDSVLESSRQSTAQKLKELSDLRYSRLLSDLEFQEAKRRLLGEI